MNDVLVVTTRGTGKERRAQKFEGGKRKGEGLYLFVYEKKGENREGVV